jgi:HSP20 family molecular chaperone IbpA
MYKFNCFPRSFTEIDQLINYLFYSFPTDTKPPLTVEEYRWDDNGDGVLISMALAGFKEEDLSVYVEDDILHISGDNTAREIPEKFKAKFNHAFPVKKNLDLTKAEVKLESGILSVTIPLISPDKSRSYLFGEPTR